MPTKNNSTVIILEETSIRTNLPLETPVNKCCLLLHGWNGNENSMQIFFPDLPERMGIIAPRAFFPTIEGGFTWANSLIAWSTIQKNRRSPLEELMDSVHKLNNSIDAWLEYFNIFPQDIYIAGFSQGGAMALLLGLSYPKKYPRFSCMSGYLPQGFDLSPLKNQPTLSNKILVTHGTQDEIIPIEQAKITLNSLVSAGLDVDYCEDQIGHKIGLSCRKRLSEFFRD